MAVSNSGWTSNLAVISFLKNVSYKSTRGRFKAREISGVHAAVQSQASVCRVCVGQSATGTDFSPYNKGLTVPVLFHPYFVFILLSPPLK